MPRPPLLRLTMPSAPTLAANTATAETKMSTIAPVKKKRLPPRFATKAAPTSAPNMTSLEAKTSTIGPVKKKKLPPRSATKMRAAEKRLKEKQQKIQQEKETARVQKECADKQTSERLRTRFLAQQKRPEYLKMLAGRKKLPAMRAGHQEEILHSIESNQVVVISGATGYVKNRPRSHRSS